MKLTNHDAAMTEIIQAKLGVSYVWQDDELWYQGHPMSFDNQLENEKTAIAEAKLSLS